MIEGAQQVIMNFFMGFAFGAFPFFLLMKGFLSPFLNVKFNPDRFLVMVHMPDGIGVRFRVGKPYQTGVKFRMDKKDYLFTLSEGVTKRTMGVNWVQVPLNDTAPFNFKKVEWLEREEEVEEEGKTKKVPQRVLGYFQGWNDSHAVMILIRTALMQPKSALSMGKLDFKKLLIIGGAVLIAIYLVNSGMLGGASNVIN